MAENNAFENVENETTVTDHSFTTNLWLGTHSKLVSSNMFICVGYQIIDEDEEDSGSEDGSGSDNEEEGSGSDGEPMELAEHADANSEGDSDVEMANE
jgi:hypothetical protein